MIFYLGLGKKIFALPPRTHAPETAKKGDDAKCLCI